MSRRSHKNRRENRSKSSSNNSGNSTRNANGTNNTNNMNNQNMNSGNNNMQGNNNGLFGLNPNQLLASMFGNVDMGQINNILQSMNTQGFDFNNLNLGNLQGMMGNMNGMMGNNMNQQPTQPEDFTNNSSGAKEEHNKNSQNPEANVDFEDDTLNSKNDENIQMLMAIRSIVGNERGAFIDKIIGMYNDGAFDD